MKQWIRRISAGFFSLYFLTASVFAARELIPVGEVIGLDLAAGEVTVAAFDEHLSSGRDAGLQIGDRILSVDGRNVDCAEDVRKALRVSDGTVDLTVSRKNKEFALSMEPEITPEGPKIGVYLRQGITGIGTVTWYDPDTGAFGTLGHGVNDGKGTLLPMTDGKAYPASIVSVQKGKSGQPGQLKGALDGSHLLGQLWKNTDQGVFGNCSKGWGGKAIPTASYQDIRTGDACIRSTVDSGAAREYSVEILKIYPKNRADCRNFLIRVTDPALLEATGGIVQGMSGSPIIQNGKLIGAVTHVLVNDPTTGYGIFIENMLDAAA